MNNAISAEDVKRSMNYALFFKSHGLDIRSERGAEWEAICPFHEDTNPSLNLNIENGLWKCHACGAAGDVFKFYMQLTGEQSFDAAVTAVAKFSAHLVPLPSPVKKTQTTCAKVVIPPKVAEDWHQELLKAERVLKFLQERKGLSLETVNARRLGFDPAAKRITVPIYDEHGELVNIRKYHPTDTPKMLPYQTGTGMARIFPVEALADRELVLLEGEWDTMLARQLGLPGITQTCGADTFKPEWAELFRGKKIWICYDNDDAGRKGTGIAAKVLTKTAAEVRVIVLPVTKNKEDFSDWVLSYGGTADKFRELMAAAPLFGQEEAAPEPERPAEIPLDQQIQSLPPNVNFEENMAAWRGLIRSLAAKPAVAQEKYIDLIHNRFKVSASMVRKELKAIEAQQKLAPAIPAPLSEPRAVDWSLAQDMRGDLFHYGLWLPTDKGEFVFRLVTSAYHFEEMPDVPPEKLPKDSSRWSVDSKTPFNVFVYIAGEAKDTPAALFLDLRRFFQRFMWYSDPRTYDLLALWTMASYVFMIFDQCGYLALVGTKRAGKTRLFELLEMLCFNAVLSTSVSDSYVFRSVEVDRTTLLVDEADQLKAQAKEGVNERLEILRSGYRRSGNVGRIEGEDRKRVDFSTYSMKAVANVSGLEDALEDRTLAIPVERKPKHVKVEKLVRRRLRGEAQILRNRLYCFGLTNAGQLARIYDSLEIENLDDREAEIWSGIMTIAHLAAPERITDLMALARDNSSRKELHEGSESVEAQEILAVWQLVSDEDPSAPAAGPWYSVSRIQDAIKNQLGWEHFSYNRLATDMVKLKIIEDTADYKQRYRMGEEVTDKKGNTKTKMTQAMCYLLKRDRVEAAAIRFGVNLETKEVSTTQQPQASAQPQSQDQSAYDSSYSPF